MICTKQQKSSDSRGRKK